MFNFYFLDSTDHKSLIIAFNGRFLLFKISLDSKQIDSPRENRRVDVPRLSILDLSSNNDGRGLKRL